MDMMHSQAISVTSQALVPIRSCPRKVNNTTTNTTAVVLAWMDQSTSETDWIIQRNNITGNNWVRFRTVPSYSGPQTGDWAMAIDNTIPAATVPNYTYRVTAANIVGDLVVYDAPSIGFPTISRNSTVSNVNVSQSVALPGAVTIGISPGTTGDAPFNVTFTGTSSGATGWTWDFGDGNYALDNGKQNPSHVFELPGSYTVRLTAMNYRWKYNLGTQYHHGNKSCSTQPFRWQVSSTRRNGKDSHLSRYRLMQMLPPVIQWCGPHGDGRLVTERSLQ